MHVALRIVAAVPFWAKIASLVAALWVAVVQSFWAKNASRVAPLRVAAVTLVPLMTCEPPAAR